MSMFAKYQGLSSLLPSGYQEALMQPGRNIAAGISSASQSIASGIEKYGAMRERDTIIRGKVEAVVGEKMRQGGADSWFNKQSEDTQRLLVKFQGGKESHDDLLKLGSYIDASETLDAKAREEQLRAVQLAHAKQQVEIGNQNLQDYKATGVALTAAAGAQGRTSQVETRSPISPEQANAEIGRYYSGESDIAPRPGVDVSALTKYNAEAAAYRQEQAAPPVLRDNPTYANDNLAYEQARTDAVSDLSRYSRDLVAAKSRNASDNPTAITPSPHYFSQLDAQLRNQPRTESALEVAKRVAIATSARKSAEAGIAEAQAKLAALKAPEKLVAADRVLAPPVAPELSTVSTSTQTQAPTNADRQVSALKALSAAGHSVTPGILKALKENYPDDTGAEVKVVSKGGYDVVMVNGEAKHIDATGGKPMTASERAALEARVIQPEDGVGFSGVAPSAKEAEEFRTLAVSNEQGQKSISELIDIAKTGNTLNPTIRARAAVIGATLVASQRVNIVGPGAVSETEWKILHDVFANPTKVFSLKASNIKALETVSSKMGSTLNDKAKSLRLSPNSTAAASSAPASGRPTYNPKTRKFE